MSPRRSLELGARTLQTGVAGLGDVELVALVVGAARRGTARLDAARVLEHVGSLRELARVGAHDLVGAAGVGRERALRLVAAVELGRRAALELAAEHRVVVGSYASVERWARPRLSPLDHEEVWLLSLDGRNALRAARRIAQGGAHGCALTPRDVLAPALRDGASAIVLVHNHPSGDPTPSPEDVVMTRAVADACAVVGIPLLDHVVVARGGAASVFDADPAPGDDAPAGKALEASELARVSCVRPKRSLG